MRASGASASTILEDFEVHLGGVGGLKLVVYAVELPPEPVLGARVHHLGLDSGGVGWPRNEENLALLAHVVGGKFQVENSESAVALRKAGSESVVALVSSARFLHHNLLRLLVDFVDDVSVVFLRPQVHEFGLAIVAQIQPDARRELCHPALLLSCSPARSLCQPPLSGRIFQHNEKLIKQSPRFSSPPADFELDRRSNDRRRIATAGLSKSLLPRGSRSELQICVPRIGDCRRWIYRACMLSTRRGSLDGCALASIAQLRILFAFQGL